MRDSDDYIDNCPGSLTEFFKRLKFVSTLKFCISTVSLGALIWYGFLFYELCEQMLGKVDVFAGFFFYFCALFLSTFSVPFLGSAGVYIVLNVSLALYWYSLFINLDYFFIGDHLKFFTLGYACIGNGSIMMDFSLLQNKMCFSFLLLTVSIGVCASVYSLAYFKDEPHTDRFILLLHWFICSMSVFLMADNALLMFLGWELIGWTSFLLINFWTLRRGTLKAAFKAFTFNKFSDVCILLFIVTMVQNTQSYSFSVWRSLWELGGLEPSSCYGSIIFLILGASIKSAQLFGHLWLPDSMEAPIPASALIHSATLVSAGIYLIFKFLPLIVLTNLQFLIYTLGSLTAFYGAAVAAAQTDLKKLLAYSTISHCGFLFASAGFANLEFTVLYLYLHGIFKALTFFCVGNFTKLARGRQDSRTMGQFAQLYPFESIIYLYCAVNLGGLPLTLGFFYKHLFQALLPAFAPTPVNAVCLLTGMLLSLVYIYRLVYYVLFDLKKGTKIHYDLATLKNNGTLQYSNSPLFSKLAISTLLSFSFYVFYYYLSVCLTGSTTRGFLEIFSITVLEKKLALTLAQSYFIWFYVFFLVIGFILLFVDARIEFSTLYLKHLFLLAFFMLPFLLLFILLM